MTDLRQKIVDLLCDPKHGWLKQCDAEVSTDAILALLDLAELYRVCPVCDRAEIDAEGKPCLSCNGEGYVPAGRPAT